MKRIRQSQYQIFLGGIPVTADIEEVKRVIGTQLYHGVSVEEFWWRFFPL